MNKIIKNISNEIHDALSKYHNEMIYQRAFGVELQEKNIKYAEEVILNIEYKGVPIGWCRQDIVIYHNNKVIIIELKSINKLTIKERNQTKKYLINNKQAKEAYLINFGSNAPEIMYFKKGKENEIEYITL